MAQLQLPSLSDYLRHVRERAQLSRERLARYSNVSTSYLAKLEQGHLTKPTAEVLHRISAAIRLSPVERMHLFDLVNEIPPYDPVSQDQTDVQPASAEERAYADRLAPHLVGYLDGYGRVAYLNPEFDRVCAGLTDAGDMISWIFTDARAKEVHRHDWELEARSNAAWFRQLLGKNPENPFLRQVFERCSKSAEFAEVWNLQDVTVQREGMNMKLYDTIREEDVVALAQVWTSSDPGNQLYMTLAARLDLD